MIRRPGLECAPDLWTGSPWEKWSKNVLIIYAREGGPQEPPGTRKAAAVGPAPRRRAWNVLRICDRKLRESGCSWKQATSRENWKASEIYQGNGSGREASGQIRKPAELRRPIQPPAGGPRKPESPERQQNIKHSEARRTFVRCFLCLCYKKIFMIIFQYENSSLLLKYKMILLIVIL